ncbi:helix-turn-helix domain-containing protein [Pseudonocardia xishanensis]|uniref:HTH tetR-type domain-containing protein n=1 Tax=Pseudonocardia xishanensis TaxID=630995 RepID=A0ABP8S2J9_9PSEU
MILAPVAGGAGEGCGSGRVADRAPLARREQLVAAAAQEFRAKGFAGVGVDDIGGRVDVVGPALYRYFDTKADILVAAVSRWHEWPALETARVFHAPVPGEAVLGLLVEGHVRTALHATDLLAVWLTERLYLPDAVRERLDRVQADSLAEWQRWLSGAAMAALGLQATDRRSGS